MYCSTIPSDKYYLGWICCCFWLLRFIEEKTQYQDSVDIMGDIILFIKSCFSHFTGVLKIGIPYVLVLLGFIVFVIKNNGIVVGDRSMHEASFNMPQVLYMSLFVMFFSSFLLTRYMDVNRIRSIIKAISVRKCLLVLFISVLMFFAFISLRMFTNILYRITGIIRSTYGGDSSMSIGLPATCWYRYTSSHGL